MKLIQSLAGAILVAACQPGDPLDKPMPTSRSDIAKLSATLSPAQRGALSSYVMEVADKGQPSKPLTIREALKIGQTATDSTLDEMRTVRTEAFQAQVRAAEAACAGLAGSQRASCIASQNADLARRSVPPAYRAH